MYFNSFEGYFPFLRDWNVFFVSFAIMQTPTSKGISLFSGIETLHLPGIDYSLVFDFEGYFPFLRDWNYANIVHIINWR